MEARVKGKVAPRFVMDLFASQKKSIAVGRVRAKAVTDDKGAVDLAVDELSKFERKRE